MEYDLNEQDFNRLKDFKLTNNQAKLLLILINENKKKPEARFTFKQIREKFSSKIWIYRELLDSLKKMGFLIVMKESRPIMYKYNSKRLEEILKEQQEIYFRTQKKFDNFLSEVKNGTIKNKEDLLKIFDFLHSIENQHSLTMENIIILKSLFSKRDGKFIPTSKTINQIAADIKNLKIHKIRYNLKNLENTGIILSQKKSRIKYYRPLDLFTLLESERSFHQKLWDDKEKRMQQSIEFFQKSSVIPTSTSQKTKQRDRNYELRNFNKENVNWIIGLIKNAKSETYLDFRMNMERDDKKIELGRILFEALLELLRTNTNIKIRLFIYIDDWLVERLENLYYNLIQGITEGRIEIKVPLKKQAIFSRIIIDDSSVIDLIIGKDTHKPDKILLNKNQISNKEAKRRYNEEWKKSIDIRQELLEHPISVNLKNLINKSLELKPPRIILGKQPLVIIGYEKIHNIILNLYKNARLEVLTIIGTISFSTKGNLDITEKTYQKTFFESFFKIIMSHCKAGLNIRLLRNTFELDHLNEVVNDRIRRETEILVNFYPTLQIRQVDLPEYQFTIIDRKILMLHQFIESKEIQLTIITDEFIINKFYALFQDNWAKSFDIRLNWLKHEKKPIKNFLKKSLKQLEFQMSLPEQGKIKIFDGKFTKYILNHLLNKNKNEIYAFQTFSELFYKKRIDNKINDTYKVSQFILSYNWEVIKAVMTKKMNSKVIFTYFPGYIEAITYKDLQNILDLFPTYQARFIPPGIQTNVVYTIFDEYIILIVGNIVLDYQILIINDFNIREFYKAQFDSFWDNSIDLRQIFKEYGSKRRKKLIENSIKKFKLFREYHPMQIRKLFPQSD
ncbi:MAG: hypothetical protein ACTSRG_13595 [Candidatus Helarchaeota archaeon]